MSQGSFQKVDSEGNPCPEGLRAARPGSPRSAPKGTGTSMSNAADALDITCDGRFAVVVGSSDQGKPVSLVDLQASEEVDTFSDPRNGMNVATCDDGESVLITLGGDIPIVSVVRRFTISQAGTINDTGETLALDKRGDINRVFAVPGSQVGIAMTREDGMPQFSRLISFGIPGLNLLDSVTLTGQIGNAAAVSCDGTKVYVRSGNREPANDVIEGFALDPITGVFYHTPILTINDVSFVNLTLFDNPLGVSHDATLLIASEPAIIPTPDSACAASNVFRRSDWRAHRHIRRSRLGESGVHFYGTVPRCGPFTNANAGPHSNATRDSAAERGTAHLSGRNSERYQLVMHYLRCASRKLARKTFRSGLPDLAT